MSARRDEAGAGAWNATLPFVVYVEGPRDRDVLVTWAKCVAPGLARPLAASTVILGGRQPARAASHLAQLRARQPRASGLCVLDADDAEATPSDAAAGLELHTWARRHIESYLLVPAAILRASRIPDPGGRLERQLCKLLPASDDEEALRTVDAKRLLGPRGPVAALLGRAPAPGRIARAMRAEEIHSEVRELLVRLRSRLDGHEVGARSRRSTSASR